MNKNILRFLLSAVLLMCCMTANAVGIQPSGEGTSANPYQIATKEHLLWFADYVNQGNLTACAILTANITVNNGVLNSNGNLNNGTFETWTPIGNWGDGSGYKGFAGEFNGDGHTISGLYFSDETKAPVGLFGIADNNGYIHDVGGPTANFRRPACDKQLKRGACPNKQCLFPAPLPTAQAIRLPAVKYCLPAFAPNVPEKHDLFEK